MKNFNRGLDSAVPQVEKFLGTEIGNLLKNDNKFQICIREEYINVYYQGCSILKYCPIFETYEIHHKYAQEKLLKRKYIKLNKKGDDFVVNDFSLLKLIKAPERFTDVSVKKRINPSEKEYLAKYILSDQAPAIIDLEVAYSCDATKLKIRNYVAKRIDLAVIENNKLRLIEVKIDTDSRLRSTNDGEQEILNQMKSYKKFISTQSPNIISSYKTIAQNIIDLNLINKMGGNPNITCDDLRSFIVSENCLDPDPVLLIIETGKNKNGRNNVNHWDRLTAQFKGLGFPPVRTWDGSNIIKNSTCSVNSI